MDESFLAAMRRALAQTRAGDPQGATRAIQAALAGRDHPPAPAPAAARALPPAPDLLPPGPAPHAPRRPRSRLRETLARLRRAAPAPAPDAPLPDGARWEARTLSTPHGSREAMLFVPAGPVRGLILMLHGCTQNARDFARGTGMNEAAAAAGLAVLYPSQGRTANPQGCWNWFRPGDQDGRAGEPAMLAAMAREIAAELAVPAGAIFAAGLSAGGAMAAILGAESPGTFAAIGVHSGLPPGSARDVPSAFAAMRGEGLPPPRAGALPRTIVIHGTADATVAPAAGAALAAAAPAGTGVRTEAGTDAAGRRWHRATRTDAGGRPVAEHWTIAGLGHAWSGGRAAGSYTDPGGPDASAAMVRFFLA